jgi:hypothetical protein
MAKPFSQIAEEIIKELYRSGLNEPFTYNDIAMSFKVNDVTTQEAINRNFRLLLELDYIQKINQELYKFGSRAEAIIDWIKQEQQKKKEKLEQEQKAELLRQGINPDEIDRETENSSN